MVCIIHLLTSIALNSDWMLTQQNCGAHQRFLREMGKAFAAVSQGPLSLFSHPLLFGKTLIMGVILFKIFFFINI